MRGPVTLAPAAGPVRRRRRLQRLAAAAAAVVVMAGASQVLSGGDGDDDIPLLRERPADVAAAGGLVVERAGDLPVAPAEPPTGPAYRVVSAAGSVSVHGWYPPAAPAAPPAQAPVVAQAELPYGEGYWLAAADGGVFAYGDAAFHGSAADVPLSRPVVGMASTPSGHGYWLVAGDGGVFAFGDASYHGSLVELGVRSRVVAVASTPSGNGYWLVARDGGVFAFGDAAFHGALAGTPLHRPVASVAVTPSGGGYWLVARDGGVFAFGDAPYVGSTSGMELSGDIVGISRTASGHGYWLVGEDGGVFGFGDAPFLGAAATDAPVVAVAGGIGRTPPPAPEAVPQPAPAPVPEPAPPVLAAPPAAPEPQLIAAAAPAPAGPAFATVDVPHRPGDIGGRVGWDISYPQCGGPQPPLPFEYGIVGVNGGRAFRHNKCLAQEWDWARASGAAGVYVNVNFPRAPWELDHGATGPQPDCNGAISCVAYNFGFNGIQDSLAYAHSQGVDTPFVWLDVETMNYWTKDQPLNAVVIRGAIDALRQAGKDVGVYSTPLQWRQIAGDFAPGLPVWSAGADGPGNVPRYCAERGFGGGPVAIVQMLPITWDENIACPGAGPLSRYFLVKPPTVPRNVR